MLILNESNTFLNISQSSSHLGIKLGAAFELCSNERSVEKTIETIILPQEAVILTKTKRRTVLVDTP